MKSGRVTPRGFTLVELLVVVAIIGLLAGLLVPALGAVRSRARASVSQNNLRQWGAGYVNYASSRKGLTPWEGEKAANTMMINLRDRVRFWGNVVPPLLDQGAYAELSTPNGEVPTPPEARNIFVDPSAESPGGEEGYAESRFTGWLIPGSTRQRFFFTYVPNSNLNNTLTTQLDQRIANDPSDPRHQTNKSRNTSTNVPVNPEWIDARCIRLSMVPKAAQTPLLMEMRSVYRELDIEGYAITKPHPFRNELLNRHRGDWQRFSARHRGGGHLLMADGHVEWESNGYVCTPVGSSAPAKSGEFNKERVIWDPLGPSVNN